MNEETARRLIRLNNDFYRANATSFSATRGSAWPGWKRATSAVEAPPSAVLDVACGNLRFKAFADSLPGWAQADYHAVDSCRALVSEAPGVVFHEVDVLDRLLAGDTLANAIGAPLCPFVICSGFMHHVPGEALRARLLRELLSCASPGGVVIVSFWRFADDPALARKAEETTAAAGELATGLEAGDYLVGWNGEPGVLRYCHSFTDAELDRLAAAVADQARLADRYAADGRNSALNGYLVFRTR